MLPPVVLMPGLESVPPDHWMSIWAAENPDFILLEPVDVTRSLNSEDWVEYLDDCLREFEDPAILVAWDLGCSAAVWWSFKYGLPLKVAMLVGPLGSLNPNFPTGLENFSMLPNFPMAFPAVMIGSQNDPMCSYEQAAQMAATWHCQLIDGGHCGHFRPGDGLGAWPAGQDILQQLREL